DQAPDRRRGRPGGLRRGVRGRLGRPRPPGRAPGAPGLILFLLLAGCPRSTPPLPVPVEVPAPVDLGAPIDYGVWMEAGGLMVTIPQGWSGRTGPTGSSLLAGFTHADSGIRVELWA